MGYLQGLAAISEEMSKQGDFEDRQKATWVSLKDGESSKLTPLQELDEGSPNYSAKNGLGRVVLEHSNPDNWQKKAECTVDEGSCYGCSKGWHQKKILYVNVLEEKSGEEPRVAIYSRALGKGSVAQTFINVASDEDYGFSITDKVFKYSRTGSTKDNTTYTLSPLPKASTVKVENYQLWDLDQAPFHVDPEKQEDYYNGVPLKDAGKGKASAEAPAAPATAASVDVDW